MTEVARLRIQRGLTKKELALAASVSAQTITRMEMSSSDRKGGISISAACLVARALGEEVDIVFLRTELNETQGRPAQTGVQKAPKTHRKTPSCTRCGTEAALALLGGQSECCEALVAA